MQPVQDLTVEDRVSRTQFQYTLEDPSADELNVYAPKLLAKLQQLPELRDAASDQQVLGLQTRLVYDRVTASRLGITPSAIDQTLYDAYGQRQVSTMFTQLNQYHVILEVKPDFHQKPIDLRGLFIRTGAAASTAGGISGGTGTAVTSGPTSSATASQASLNSTGSSNSVGAQPVQSTAAYPNGGQVPLSAFSTIQTLTAPIAIEHQGQFPVVTLSFNLAPNASLGEAVDAVNKAKESVGCRPASKRRFKAARKHFKPRSPTSRC